MNNRLNASASRALEYLLVIVVSCVIVAIRYLLQPWLQADAPLFVLVLAPIIASIYGARPALFSTALCLLAGWFLFLEPFNSFYLDNFTDLIRLGMFAVAGLWISWLGGVRRAALVAVEASRQRQELAVEAADLGVFELNLIDDKAIWENDRMYEIFGYTRQEGPPNRREFYESCVYKDDLSALKASLQRGMRPGKNFHAIARIIRKSDKTLRLIELSGKFLFDSSHTPYKIIGVARDITEPKAMEDIANAMHNRLQTLLDNVPAYIYQMDDKGNFEFVNKAYAELVGHSADDLVGQPISAVFNAEEAEAFVEHNDIILNSRDVKEFEEQAWVKGAVHIYSSIKAPLFDDKGKAESVLGISTDITERKRIEHEMQESDRRKDEFLAVLGHELRNPLAPLRAGIELLEHEKNNPAMVEGIRTMMHRQVNHLVRLVDDLLNMSRISRGLVELQPTHIDLNLVVQAAMEQVRPLLMSRNHEWSLQVTEHPLSVFGDFDRLTQVIVNLLTNAGKFTPPGGKISVMTCIEGNKAVFQVRDNGYGIPAPLLSSIFNMFIQVQEHKVHTGGEGLGIGLALSRQFVEQHMGTISASSKGEGMGSVFTVRIPLHEMPRQTLEQPQIAVANIERRILVVDDNQDAATSLCALLNLKGHTTHAVYDGPAALACLAEYNPQVILMDIGMPGMNGYEVARLIRALPESEKIHLIALTGWGQKADKLNAREAGFDDHLTKPVDTGLLWNLLARTKKTDHLQNPEGKQAAPG
ncbi:MAG: PAS domain S-box protein [Pseudomonadota bacterium]